MKKTSASHINLELNSFGQVCIGVIRRTIFSIMVCVLSFEINPTNPTVIWTFNSIRLSLQELGEEGFADSEVAIRPLTTFAQTAAY